MNGGQAWRHMRTRLGDRVTRLLQLSWIVDTSLLEFIRLAGAGVQTMTTASAARWVHFDPGAVAELKLGCRAVPSTIHNLHR